MARLLCADALEQLAYQSESGAWRNAYLTGALELRFGLNVAIGSSDIAMLPHLSPSMMFDMMGIMLDKTTAGTEDFSINFTITDTGEQWMLRFLHGAVLKFEDYHNQDADLSIVCEKSSIYTLLCQDADTFLEESQVTGDESWLYYLCENLSEIPVSEGVAFTILTP